MPPLHLELGGGHGEATTSNAHLLVVVCSLIVGVVCFVVVIQLHAVIVNFVDDRESLMPLCGLAHTFSASSSINFSPLPTVQKLMNFLALSISSFSVSFEQSSWCWRPMLLEGGRGSKVTYPSIFYAAKGRHLVSVLSFCLDEICLGHLHPNQIKRVREFG